MAKRTSHSKKSVRSLPKGLPVRGKTSSKQPGRATGGGDSNNPFEAVATQRRPKFAVHNRPISTAKAKAPSALAAAIQQRQSAISAAFKQQRKSNVFSDKRIGEAGNGHPNQLDLNVEERNVQRLVRERARQSKRIGKYSLNDDAEEDVLTHKGKAIDTLTAADHVILSEEEEGELGNLDAYDTEMHFGGDARDQKESAVYGSNGTDLSMAYSQKKTDLDDLIVRRKLQKQERLKSKENQVDKFEAMDNQFSELANLLQFRDKEADIRSHIAAKRGGTLSTEDQEYAEWDKEMKQYLHVERKVAATDRTKTAEETAKEEADELHEMETRRMARMNGDFEADDLDSDASDEDKSGGRKKRISKSAKKRRLNTAEALDDDSDDEEGEDSENQWTTRFTADGLVYIDKGGIVQGRVADVDAAKNRATSTKISEYNVGDKVLGSYRAKEQFGQQESWFNGTIVSINEVNDTPTYNIEYDDGDFEDDVETCHIRPIEKTSEEVEAQALQKDKEMKLKRKRQQAKEEARAEIPYVFEVPTTLDALHELIGKYATTGNDVSLIIQRIYKANSVRLDHRNKEKMQNFYDVLIRRFVAVGDAIYLSGSGGDELRRYSQLDDLTHILYSMAQDSADTAGAVWSRRLGFLQSAHVKRLRDAGMDCTDDTKNDEGEYTAWPSTGVILALRALCHVFPVTDKRHPVVSPAVIFLGQIVGHTPISSVADLVSGLICCGLLIEYTREAKRLAPEAHAFLASVIRLFAMKEHDRLSSYQLPTFKSCCCIESLSSLRSQVIKASAATKEPFLISLESSQISNAQTPAAILYAALHLVESSVMNLAGTLSLSEKEVYAEITNCVICLEPASKPSVLPSVLQTKIASVATTLSSCCQWDLPRQPLQRRLANLSANEMAIPSLAPRIENPDRYSITQKDKGKSAMQAAADRSRREYKREHKAVARELRLDGAVLEQTRRDEQHKKDEAAKSKRQKAFAWLEGEQATMNQQVRQGGGLLQGGGMGAAKAKARSGKFGIKKGGKLR